jgi:Flp pilus assembly protein TadG
MRRAFLRKNRSERRGAAVVEFAIVAPVFFLLVIGLIEFGRALMVQQVLTNASRVGARTAIGLNTTTTQVINAATQYASGASVPGVAVNVDPTPAAAETGQPITVTVTIDYEQVSWLPAPWFMDDTTLSASSIMRKEGFE